MGLFIGKITDEGYEPPLIHRWLSPRVSGNEINGLGEPGRRPPRPVYWHEPRMLAHGWLQRLLTARARFTPALWRVGYENEVLQARRHRPIATTKKMATPEEWAEGVRKYAGENEADLVGIARVDPDWVFEGYRVSTPWIVVLGVAMDHARLSTAPAIESVDEVMAQYNRGVRAAKGLANWIRSQGMRPRATAAPRQDRWPSSRQPWPAALASWESTARSSTATTALLSASPAF